MNAELTRTKRRVKRIVRQVERELGLSWIKFTHAFNEAEDDEGCSAQCRPSWEYRQATVEWNLANLASSSDDELRDIVTHEFVHVLVDPLVSLLSEEQQKDRHVEKLTEYVTESVARVIASARSTRA